jgi:hypothetical protein
MWGGICGVIYVWWYINYIFKSKLILSICIIYITTMASSSKSAMADMAHWNKIYHNKLSVSFPEIVIDNGSAIGNNTAGHVLIDGIKLKGVFSFSKKQWRCNRGIYLLHGREHIYIWGKCLLRVCTDLLFDVTSIAWHNSMSDLLVDYENNSVYYCRGKSTFTHTRGVTNINFHDYLRLSLSHELLSTRASIDTFKMPICLDDQSDECIKQFHIDLQEYDVVAIDESKTQSICVACITNESKFVFVKCGHLVYCVGCSDVCVEDSCPICRVKSDRLLIRCV